MKAFKWRQRANSTLQSTALVLWNYNIALEPNVCYRTSLLRLVSAPCFDLFGEIGLIVKKNKKTSNNKKT